MDQSALRANATALSEPRYNVLDEMAEMGSIRNLSTTVTPPAFPIPWPLQAPEEPPELQDNRD
jgi:hypothetical protein